MHKLDWKSYEELVKDIYEQFGKGADVKSWAMAIATRLRASQERYIR